MTRLSRHAEWLSLIEISGPFLTVSMLDKAFPQGLEAVETPRRQKLRAAYEEWREAVDQEDKLLPKLHREWVRLVLKEMLEYDHESLVHAGDWPGEIPSVSSQEHAGTFKPGWIVRSPADGKPCLFIAVLPPDTDLGSVQRGDGWPVSLQERMTLLCRAHGVRVGLLTDGERWMLVNAPVGSTSSQASWYARLWFQEPITLKAFQSLFDVRRCFGPAEDTLESLLDESLKHHEEVTDTLGEQVRRAVEVLVQCLDKADEDRNRELLRDVKPADLYETGLTVMMRLVFVLCAEERGLLLLGDSVYDRCYAVSTLRGQLAEEADRHGPEVLDRRHDAWARLLAVFRAVSGGIEHESLRMPALGGSLFDPDRFPFLEGRAKGTRWRDTSAAPLPIDNRTVLLLLNSLQILEQSGGALLLSYRALDIEQIGHVYEGLLEHTVARVPRVTLGLQGSQKAKNPNVALAELESARLDGEAVLVKLVLEVTGRSESAIRKGLSKPADDTVFGRVLGVCGGDTELAERIRPFTNLLRTDAWDDPIVYRDNSFMVTLGADRRETGTHYTPKSLTESIVTSTLEPVVYVGPAEGKPREEWTLKSSREILDLKVCDPAMGSGAFLVQACRFLGKKLVESWLHEEAEGKAITVDGEALDQLGAEEPLPSQLDERLTIARSLVAERCLYGVDVNPLAVELAKLSIWLVTLAKGRPFGFLDHNLRSGDSLLGIHRLEQLTRLRMDAESGRQYQLRIFGQNVEAAVNEAVELRKRLRSTTIRDIRDVEDMARLDREARRKLESVELIADAMIGEALRCGGNTRALDTALNSLSTIAGDFLSGNANKGEQITRQARTLLSIDLPYGKLSRKPFHWALEFPEVFESGGFDGIVGNPPFMGGKKISGGFGSSYREYIVEQLADGVKGNADLCVFFFIRASRLIKIDRVFGLLATNTIAQGDTREVGLDQIARKGGKIIKAIPSQKWPGKANLEVAIVWIAMSETWYGDCFIHEDIVDGISSYLVDIQTVTGVPYQLKANDGIAYVGQIVLGDGFVLTSEEAAELLKTNPKNRDVLFEYLSGNDVTSRPDQSPSRWVINFFDWPLKRENGGILWKNSDEHQKKNFIDSGVVPVDYPFPVAEDYSDCLDVIKSRVLPERMKLKDNTDGKKYKKYWWRYGRLQDKLLKGLNDIDRVLFHSFTGKYVSFTFSEKNKVFAGPHNVILLDRYCHFALLQSTLHYVWVREYGSTMKKDIRYATSDVLKTFPFPENKLDIEQIGETYYRHRQEMMTIRNEGLTDTYNRFHDPKEISEDTKKLRELHIKMDEDVATAYFWDDVDLQHGFHETKQGVRFTVSEEARREVLQRLLKLNHERHEEEVKNRLYQKTVTNGLSTSVNLKKSEPENNNSELFDFISFPLAAVSGSDHAILNYLSATDVWRAKDDILTGSGIPANQWQSTINRLLTDGLVERQGERRGAKYRSRIRSQPA
jgi:hypothetical protein